MQKKQELLWDFFDSEIFAIWKNRDQERSDKVGSHYQSNFIAFWSVSRFDQNGRVLSVHIEVRFFITYTCSEIDVSLNTFVICASNLRNDISIERYNHDSYNNWEISVVLEQI